MAQFYSQLKSKNFHNTRINSCQNSQSRKSEHMRRSFHILHVYQNIKLYPMKFHNYHACQQKPNQLKLQC